MLCFLSFSVTANALAYPSQEILGVPSSSSSIDNPSKDTVFEGTKSTPEGSIHDPILNTLQDLITALQVMQDRYFVLWQGTWPTSIDWTAAVLGTHVSAALSSLTSGPLNIPDTDELQGFSFFRLENTVNRFFSHISAFYFGENSFSLRNQAYDDMLWVVLGWLENIKFQNLHSDLHYVSSNNNSGELWYGTQFQNSAAHRARIFYELASAGWDKTLCGGGMIWSPYLMPYKNAITNELYISASIEMYLYFPGDSIDAPFLVDSQGPQPVRKNPHNPLHLKAAIDGYEWLKTSNMTGISGLYADGFHISGWQSTSNPGSGQCDELNSMVYTYNQGVVLSGLRGLWLATNSQAYLRDGHELVHEVLQATGWPHTSSQQWKGLGRGGVLEDACDSRGVCSQDGQTFKGIFFHHLSGFCRPLQPQEKQFLADTIRRPAADDDWAEVYKQHIERCRAYRPWIEHNAQAALMTRDRDGKFGTWWGRSYHQLDANEIVNSSTIPDGAVDYRNADSDLKSSTTGSTSKDYNDRGRGRTVETQSGGIAVLRALYQWQSYDEL
ncbi:Six-hairpin glycosidase [Penicillium cf. griseofulvum]|uniref:Six-hairpin glycosidase n=1 Tax=Penicillium cf. griseofulvum TaxID=2972120 RepID=A0A9W9IW85_9EURO|nr:Six-hairpin glycosidase [Penicillium cf. griseofulvum]KAJ5430061.1 Six-hairpin glycosidase [Penicillium cf. griseofulvum]KAJ5436165.1 Six-hairpin glycosidase [Penicillium cf. griseofulvum]